MKGVIAGDHIPVNKYQLLIIGMPPLTITKISGIEDELETTELPDRTVASGGNRKATEFSMTIPSHHTVEQIAMEVWFRESQDPVSPTYKKVGTLVQQSISGTSISTKTLIGVFPKKRSMPDLEMSNEGEMSEVEWMMSADDIEPI